MPIWSNNNLLGVPNLYFVWYWKLGPWAEQDCQGKSTILCITQANTHQTQGLSNTGEFWEISLTKKKDNLHCQRKGLVCITFWVRKGGKLKKIDIVCLFWNAHTLTTKNPSNYIWVFCSWKSNEGFFREKQSPQACWFSVYQHIALCQLWHSKYNIGPNQVRHITTFE